MKQKPGNCFVFSAIFAFTQKAFEKACEVLIKYKYKKCPLNLKRKQARRYGGGGAGW